MATIDGWSKANGAEPKMEPLSDEEHDELLTKYADT